MTTNQAADVLVRIADPASNIMHDQGVVDMLQQLMDSDDSNPVKFIADNLTTVTTILLKDHRDDVFEIVATLAGKTASEVAEQRITETIKDIKESWDGELVGFFGSLK